MVVSICRVFLCLKFTSQWARIQLAALSRTQHFGWSSRIRAVPLGQQPKASLLVLLCSYLFLWDDHWELGSFKELVSLS